jgi:hypothetical protein
MPVRSTWFYVSPQPAPIGSAQNLQVCRMEVASRELTKKITLLDFYLEPDINGLLRVIDLFKGHPRPLVTGDF